MKRALEGLPGVAEAAVDLDRDTAIVEYQAGVVAPRELVQAVQRVVVLPGLRRVLEEVARPDRREKR
ncbi:MAG TPA: heavy-metal-associated domain-containing protein [Candidatus Methylomirabilis sp.]|nr:heavy-metal-associated domain-containing protein [Candidatus Methylomirabilis sp.]